MTETKNVSRAALSPKLETEHPSTRLGQENWLYATLGLRGVKFMPQLTQVEAMGQRLEAQQLKQHSKLADTLQNIAASTRAIEFRLDARPESIQLLKTEELLKLLCFGKSKLNYIRDPKSQYHDPDFPIPIQIGGCHYYKLVELQEWLAKQPRAGLVEAEGESPLEK